MYSSQRFYLLIWCHCSIIYFNFDFSLFKIKTMELRIKSLRIQLSGSKLFKHSNKLFFKYATADDYGDIRWHIGLGLNIMCNPSFQINFLFVSFIFLCSLSFKEKLSTAIIKKFYPLTFVERWWWWWQTNIRKSISRYPST